MAEKIEKPAGDVTICEVCAETMGRFKRQPVCLPGCGHTFCRECLIHINNVDGALKCPTCRFLHWGLPPEKLPVNWAVVALLEPEEEQILDKSLNSIEAPDPPTPSPSSSTSESFCKIRNHSSNGSENDSELATDIDSDPVTPIGKAALMANIGILTGCALVAAVPMVLGGVGFGSRGIAGGSYAAEMMSKAAIANGGRIARGSLVSVLQSTGAAGISAATTAILGATGAAAGAGAAYGYTKLAENASNNDFIETVAHELQPEGSETLQAIHPEDSEFQNQELEESYVIVDNNEIQFESNEIAHNNFETHLESNGPLVTDSLEEEID